MYFKFIQHWFLIKKYICSSIKTTFFDSLIKFSNSSARPRFQQTLFYQNMFTVINCEHQPTGILCILSATRLPSCVPVWTCRKPNLQRLYKKKLQRLYKKNLTYSDYIKTLNLRRLYKNDDRTFQKEQDRLINRYTGTAIIIRTFLSAKYSFNLTL